MRLGVGKSSKSSLESEDAKRRVRRARRAAGSEYSAGCKVVGGVRAVGLGRGSSSSSSQAPTSEARAWVHVPPAGYGAHPALGPGSEPWWSARAAAAHRGMGTVRRPGRSGHQYATHELPQQADAAAIAPTRSLRAGRRPLYPLGPRHGTRETNVRAAREGDALGYVLACIFYLYSGSDSDSEIESRKRPKPQLRSTALLHQSHIQAARTSVHRMACPNTAIWTNESPKQRTGRVAAPLSAE
ncbi:hypothetical protein TARUN_1784 [Trichoderma arundinaceum]|uniref:Uncharacterized protein n=1 Tax=Trichoderma arundinaceum TaxID=490622 RepID=A0A395NWF1_TRIAR|nr:hypothetical protein TARUN_1784 [Trichoderma arundinaceum]